MIDPAVASSSASVDHLVEYVSGVSKLPGKLAVIAANQRSTELSLGRAAAALRAMGSLSRTKISLDSRNYTSKVGNSTGASV